MTKEHEAQQLALAARRMKAFQHDKQGAAFGGGMIRRNGEKPVDRRGTKIVRTSAGLRDALFDAIEKVRDGEMAHEDAKAISGLASQICNSVSLEIEVAKLRTEYPADAKLIIPSPLPLGPAEESGT